MSDQFGRKASLIVVGATDGLDLSQLRFRFEIRQSDLQSPNTAFIRVYNLSDATIKKVQGEFTRVVVQAGYEKGNFGVVFDGTIKQFRRGKERNVDSFLDILAADGDIAYNSAFLNATVAAGATAATVGKMIAGSFETKGAPLATDATGLIAGANPAALSRGKVMFGMARDYMRDWSTKNGFRWSIQNGQLVVVPITGYRAGEAVKINSQTGMIGVPEATDGGIRVRCLLNPLIRIGALLQINNADINRTQLNGATGIDNQLQFAATVTDDGFYRVLVSEFSGDTRGQEWYTDIVCLAVDTSAPADQSVKAYG